MYASKRSIGKQGVWAGAPADKYADKKIKHGNRKNKNGNKFYVQTITKPGAAKDANETMTRTIVHEASGNTFRLRRKKKRLSRCMKNQPK
jgi:hypothetical protein